jgi:hypothetical protein
MTPAAHRTAETHPGSEIHGPELEFIQAMARFQKQTRTRYPTWRDVLSVVHSLGYRRIDITAPTTNSPALEVRP